MSHAENTIIEPKNRIPKTIIFFIFLLFESNGKNTEFIERVENFFSEKEKRKMQSKNTIFAAPIVVVVLKINLKIWKIKP